MPVYAVGLGPGPLDLITLRAEKVLRMSDRLFILGEEGSWPVRLVQHFVSTDRIRRYAPKALKWGLSRDDPIHEQIASEIAGLVRGGKQVSVAAPGDMSFYSSFGYLQAPLARLGIQWEYVPGISFVQAASLATGTTLTDDRDTLVVTRVDDVSELDSIFEVATVVVLYDVTIEKMADLSKYAIHRGLRFAKTAWIGSDKLTTYAVDLMEPEPALRRGSVVLSRHIAGQRK